MRFETLRCFENLTATKTQYSCRLKAPQPYFLHGHGVRMRTNKESYSYFIGGRL